MINLKAGAEREEVPPDMERRLCWRTSAIVVTRVASSVNRMSLAKSATTGDVSRGRRASSFTNTSAFAPELNLVRGWAGVNVQRSLLTTVDVVPEEGDAEELTLSVWRFDWCVPLFVYPQAVYYQVVYAGKSTKDTFLCYHVPALGANPEVVCTPSHSLLNRAALEGLDEKKKEAKETEVREHLQATWRHIIQRQIFCEPHHILGLQTNLLEMELPDAHEIVNRALPLVEFADSHPDVPEKTKSKGLVWRLSHSLPSSSELLQYWHTHYYKDVVFTKKQQKKLFAMAIVKLVDRLSDMSLARLLERIPLVTMWPADVMTDTDVFSSSATTLSDVARDVYALFFVGRLPKDTGSVSKDGTPDTAFQGGAFDAGSMQHTLVNVHKTSMLVLDMPDEPITPQLALAKIEEEHKKNPDKAPERLIMRLSNNLSESDHSIVDSVYAISERLGSLPEEQRETQRQRFVYLRSLFQFVNKCPCHVLSVQWGKLSVGSYLLKGAAGGEGIELKEITPEGAFIPLAHDAASPPDGDEADAAPSSPSSTSTASAPSAPPPYKFEGDAGAPPQAPSLYFEDPDGDAMAILPCADTVLKANENIQNPWLEPEEGAWNIVLESPSVEHWYCVRQGSLNKLVHRLVTPPPTEAHQALHDTYDLYMNMFFLTYRAFVDPEELLDRITAFFSPPPGLVEAEAELLIPPFSSMQNAVCKLLVHWFNHHFNDFNTKKTLLTKLREFVDKAFEQYERAKRKVKKVGGEKEQSAVPYLRSLIEKKSAKGTYTSMFDSTIMVHNPPPPIIPSSWRGVTFFELDELEIARQLSIEQFHIYVMIQPLEFQNLAWSKAKLKHRAENLLQLIEVFNTFSSKVATAILTTPTLKKRKLVVEKFVRVAHNLVELNNFNMAMSILSAFNAASVHRLKFTFEGLGKKAAKMLADLQELMSSEQAYKNIRKAVASAQPPCIPFLGVYLTDLTFVEDGNPDKVKGLINFRKRQLEYDVIVKILRFQKKSYPLTMVRARHIICTLRIYLGGYGRAKSKKGKVYKKEFAGLME
eukprot:TRINITY_DN9432_c0_g1_i1.p1 TRINITY_DN9432_c0_g1~~TRINITY_DN9432_c0_g1_i1.p1  ORF type:complete len:1120 (-),score=371.40 TRINITY_DN9432_c0_g1_i1:107-3226(-)